MPRIRPTTNNRTATIDDVRIPVDAYRPMQRLWRLVSDLRGGTLTMRSAGRTWLPKYDAESQKAYEVRLNRSVLYPAYEDAVEKLVDKPFTRPVVLSEMNAEEAEKLVQIESDVDLTGRNLSAFAKAVFEAAIDHGVTFVLVDYPAVSPDMTLAQEREQQIRPVLVHVTAPQLIGWQWTGSGSTRKLTQVRIREYRTEPVGKYGQQDVEYIRVITPESFTLFRVIEREGEPELISTTPNTLGFVPFLAYYIRPTGFMTGKPALEGLAWLNIAHWVSDSDHRNILAFARFGLLFGAGIEDEEADGMVIGPNRLIRSANQDAKLGYVEHTGKAIEAGERDMRTLEQRMEVLGLQPFVQRTGVETATGKVMNEQKSVSAIKTWIRDLQDLIHNCYAVAAKWSKENLPKNFKVDVFSDFEISPRTDVDLRLLFDMTMASRLSVRTMLKEAVRRGVLPEDFNIDAEIEQIMEEGITFTELAAGGSMDPVEETEGNPPSNPKPPKKAKKPAPSAA